MKRARILTVVAAAVTAGLAWGRIPRRLCSGFLPPNNMRIAIDSKEAGGLTQQQFDEVLDKVQAIYAPIVASRGGTLEVERRWEDPTVNAMATREGSRWVIHMYGGLARHKDMTQDGFTLVACHELGHHLGGAPKLGFIFKSWASNEGQSDYFGNLKCMRRVFADARSSSFSRASLTDPLAEKTCSQSFPNPSDRDLCVRGAVAGLSLARLLQDIGHEEKTPQFDTPDPTVVWRTNNDHPKAQCRLDTYFQASVCSKPVSEDVDDRNPANGTCTRAQGYSIGMRPLCWYKPAAGELLLARNMTPISVREPGAALRALESPGLWASR